MEHVTIRRTATDEGEMTFGVDALRRCREPSGDDVSDGPRIAARSRDLRRDVWNPATKAAAELVTRIASTAGGSC